MLCCSLVKLLRSYLRWRLSPLWSLPGPTRGSFLLGHFMTIQKEPFMAPQKRWWKEAGVETHLIHYCQPLGRHSLIVLNADIVKQILFATYGKKPQYKKNLQGLIPVLGKGLVTLEGEDWQRHRRIVHPSFQQQFVKASLDDIVPSAVQKLISYWKQAKDREINLGPHLSNLTLDIIGKVAFSHDFFALESVKQWAEDSNDGNCDNLTPISDSLINAMNAMFRNTPRRIALTIFNLSMFDIPTKKTRKVMNEAVDDIIFAAREKLKHSKIPNNSHAPLSLLQRLLDAEDADPTNKRKNLTPDELRDEVKTFILAGHETTSTWLYWAIFALIKYPDVQEKVFRDISKQADEGKNITIQDIEEMPYLDAFMKEVLRLYPPAGMIVRSNVDEVFLKGTRIPARTRLVIPIHLLHRHPLYWSDPDTFKPERWLKDSHPCSHGNAYLPFSDGPRNCIGSYFAQMEAKLILAPLLLEFSFLLAPSQANVQFTFTTFITMKAKPDVKICVRSRQH